MPNHMWMKLRKYCYMIQTRTVKKVF